VTVLFCDVTGSTALGERLDPESFRQVMRRYFDTARAVIERHGGTVEKFIGDAVMAVFGVPVLHEDDALRAVRAAAGLREQIAVLNTELEAGFGARLSVRTGVNTGEVVTGTEERLATGDAVNLAARLEQAAAPGEIVIGPQTWALVRGAVTAEPLAPLVLKGKSAPVAACRLLEIRSDVDPRARPGGRRWWAGAASCGCSTTRSRTWWPSGRAACSPCWARPGWASRGWRRSSCGTLMPG
jgi:class 3 adenylate cyclase